MTTTGSMDAVRDARAARLRDLERRAGGAPWLVALRRGAFERFTALGFPTLRDEAWRHTDVAALAATAYALPPVPSSLTARDVDAVALARVAGPRLVFVNGRYAAALSSLAGLPPGVEVRPLAEMLAAPGLLEENLGQQVPSDDHAFTALNTALFEDGAWVRIAAGTVVEAPLQLLFLAAPAAAGDAVPFEMHPRVQVVAEAGSQVQIAETWSGSGAYFSNTVTEVVVGADAGVSHVKVQRESKQAQHMARLRAVLGRDARFESHFLALGAGLERNEVEVVFDGEGGDARLNGLYVADGVQHTDSQTFVDHAKPHCTSNQLYKGVLAGAARGVFNGRVVVRPQAQKTDAHQTNRNLLLSEAALVDTKPQLEIYADDVKCTHGATIGRLQEEALFYLQSRGLGPEEARDILTHAFAREVVSRVRPEGVREALEGWIGCRLAALTGGAA
jgi:Fe-S cluster assembly protein SufD